MIINAKLAAAMNEQIRHEFAASQQYVAIAIYFDMESLVELAGFFYNQAQEERDHAMKFVHFLLEAGAQPIIPSLPEFVNRFDSASAAVQFALDQEITVTNQINSMVTLAVAENDHVSNQFLQWFVTEQVEEVDSMGTLLQTIKHAGSSLLLVEDFVRRNMQNSAAAEANN